MHNSGSFVYSNLTDHEGSFLGGKVTAGWGSNSVGRLVIFLKKYSATNNSSVRGFTKRAVSKLISLKWEGNVRELENVIERAVVLCTSALIDESDIPSPEAADAETFFGTATGDFPTLEQLERRYIEMIMGKTGGRKDKASQILGVNRRTLYRKEREYGMVSADAIDENEGEHE